MRGPRSSGVPIQVPRSTDCHIESSATPSRPLSSGRARGGEARVPLEPTGEVRRTNRADRSRVAPRWREELADRLPGPGVGVRAVDPTGSRGFQTCDSADRVLLQAICTSRPRFPRPREKKTESLDLDCRIGVDEPMGFGIPAYDPLDPTRSTGTRRLPAALPPGRGGRDPEGSRASTPVDFRAQHRRVGRAHRRKPAQTNGGSADGGASRPGAPPLCGPLKERGPTPGGPTCGSGGREDERFRSLRKYFESLVGGVGGRHRLHLLPAGHPPLCAAGRGELRRPRRALTSDPGRRARRPDFPPSHNRGVASTRPRSAELSRAETPSRCARSSGPPPLGSICACGRARTMSAPYRPVRRCSRRCRAAAGRCRDS